MRPRIGSFLRRITWLPRFAVCLLAGAVSMAAEPAPPPAAGPGPTLAVEDSLPRLLPEPLPEILVQAPRLRLDEILRLVAEGEAQRDSLMQDQAYTVMLRVLGRDRTDSDDRTELVEEYVARIYRKRPDKVREIPLRRRSAEEGAGEDEEDSGVQVTTGGNMSEQFVAFAFDPSMRNRFHFQIEERSYVGGHVVYRLGFEPRSEFDLLPTGRVWIDTNDFVILREEFWYRDRSPAPLLIDTIDSVVLERIQVDGFWVLDRLLARATLSDPVRLLGRIGRKKIWKYYDIAVVRSDWIVNGGVPDSLFDQGDSPR